MTQPRQEPTESYHVSKRGKVAAMVITANIGAFSRHQSKLVPLVARPDILA